MTTGRNRADEIGDICPLRDAGRDGDQDDAGARVRIVSPTKRGLIRPAVLAVVVGCYLAVGRTPASSAAPAGAGASPLELGIRALGDLGAPASLADALGEADDELRVSPFVFPAGDLDADGADDLVALSRSPEASTLVVAGRRGSDGTELFSVDTGASGFLAPAYCR